MPIVVQRMGRCPYATALARQEQLVERKLAGDERDFLVTLEHELVYTLGRGADHADLLGAPERLEVPVHRVGRGGGVTFHGPGQLVAYPILALPRGRRDVRAYVCELQRLLVDVCRDFGLDARSHEREPGVWVGDAKIGSIGIGIRRWVTWHGVSLNVRPELRYFGAIVTCRQPTLRMTSMAEEGSNATVSDVEESLITRFVERFGYDEAAAEVVDLDEENE